MNTCGVLPKRINRDKTSITYWAFEWQFSCMMPFMSLQCKKGFELFWAVFALELGIFMDQFMFFAMRYVSEAFTTEFALVFFIGRVYNILVTGQHKICLECHRAQGAFILDVLMF